MELHSLTHNLKGLNDSLSILKHNRFLQSITPKVDSLLLQVHKLRGTKLENLYHILMPWSTGWILEAEPIHKSWFNPDGVGKGGVCILLTSKYARLIALFGATMNNRVVRIKMKE